MKPFDIDNTPETFDGFILSVKKTVEDTEVGVDEYYPDAMFTVDNFGFGKIINIDDVVNNTNIDPLQILNISLVNHIRKDNIKWYAHVSYVLTEYEEEFMLLVGGNEGTTIMSIAEIFDEGEYQYLKEWNQIDPTENFSNIVVPLRRAIVKQG